MFLYYVTVRRLRRDSGSQRRLHVGPVVRCTVPRRVQAIRRTRTVGVRSFQSLHVGRHTVLVDGVSFHHRLPVSVSHGNRDFFFF